MSLSEAETLTRIYVLRCWREPRQQTDTVPEWRFRLEDVRDEVGLGFAHLDDLLAFLQETFADNDRTSV